MPLAAAVLCVLGLGSCRVFRFSSDLAEREVVTAEGESVTRAFDSLPEFRAVEFSVPADISYSAGECALSVTTAQNVLDKLDVRVDGDVLVVGLKPGVARLKNVKAFDVVLSSPELRGVGIVDIKEIFGIGAIVRRMRVDLVIHMEFWIAGKEYDRLGLAEEFITILGVKRPHIVMPVRPGRNLAIIVEVAARNWRLNRMGFNAAAELDKRLTEMLQRAQEPQRTPLSEDD